MRFRSFERGLFITKFSRFALFVIYVWFGALKVLGFSPASPLVASLLAKTLPSIPPDKFILYLGIFEILIGILFIIPRLRLLAFALFAVHMGIATGPLIMLQGMTWAQPFLIPTLEGQYIIKNLALIAVALNLTFE